MKFITYDGPEDSPILGLASESVDQSGPIILHVHGYGGDLMSNAFVRFAHDYWPSKGMSFVSLRLPTSSYVEERYSDHGVTYLGSSFCPPRIAVETVLRVADHYHKQGRVVILQGHSFGTNIVKCALENDDRVKASILLSPADSEWLQREYSRVHRRAESQALRDRRQIDWESFGILVGDRAYPIPISVGLVDTLFDSEEFRTWSSIDTWTPKSPCLVVAAGCDPIARGGAFIERLRRLTGADGMVTVADLASSSSHSFSDAVTNLHAVICDWLRLRGIVN